MRRACCGALALLAFAGAARAQSGPTAILDRVQLNGRRPIDFHAIALPESVFVGQQATYQVAVLLSPEARSRLRRNPEFLPPELRGLLAYELGTPVRVPPRSYDGAVFEAHVFQRALFPVAAGRQVVPAPQLTYAMPQSSSYFSREERFVVNAESADFIVKPLPLVGRPDDFNGAVGVFKASIRIDTASARVGDPLVLTLRVQGTGNVKLLPRPTIEIGWASAVPGSERISVDSSGSLVRGTKEFDWILTPASEGRVAVPALRYAYFDPYAARYAVAESAPLELMVERGTLATSDEGESAELMPLRVDARGTAATVNWNGRGLPPRAWYLWLLLAALAPLPVLWSARRPREAGERQRDANAQGLAPQPDRGRSTAADGAGNAARDAARLARRDLLAALASRFNQAPQSLVSRTHVARVLRRAGVTRDTTRRGIELLERLDELGFGAGDASASPEAVNAARGSITVTSAELLRRIDAEAMPRGRSIGRATITSLLLGVAISLMTAAPVVHAQSSVDSARAAYERRAFTEAEQRFASLVVAQPRNPDLLANWGTAAWAAGDTVSAVIAWQRAARLQPLAVDVQERIGLLPSGARGGIADVAMLPVRPLVSSAVILWFAGWMLLGWNSWRRRRSRVDTPARRMPWLRGLAGGMVFVAMAAGGLAWWAMRALDPTGLAVVARPETLRIAPGTDADAMGGVSTGDVVHVIETRETWQRVVHADGRRGWLPAVRLVAMIDSLPASPSSR